VKDKKKTYHTVGTISKSNIEIMESGNNDTLITQINKQKNKEN
jgi:hypothetical protein